MPTTPTPPSRPPPMDRRTSIMSNPRGSISVSIPPATPTTPSAGVVGSPTGFNAIHDCSMFLGLTPALRAEHLRGAYLMLMSDFIDVAKRRSIVDSTEDRIIHGDFWNMQTGIKNGFYRTTWLHCIHVQWMHTLLLEAIYLAIATQANATAPPKTLSRAAIDKAKGDFSKFQSVRNGTKPT